MNMPDKNGFWEVDSCSQYGETQSKPAHAHVSLEKNEAWITGGSAPFRLSDLPKDKWIWTFISDTLPAGW